MDQFQFCCPTKIYLKKNSLDEIGDIISKDYHLSRVLLIYGSERIKKDGTYDKIAASLKAADIAYIDYGGITPNPDIEDVKKIVDSALTFKPDLLLAVGGGSVIDAAKLASHGYYYKGNPLDFNKHKLKPLNSLKVGVILTIPASGSEMSDSCVISDRRTGFKGGFNDVSNYPLFALLDPTLTYSLPDIQLSYGLVDMFSHSFERYFSPSDLYEPADELALAVMKSIVFISPEVYKKPCIYEARRAMMILGSLSHNGITSYGKDKKFIVHQAEHKLSGLYPELAHGQGIALLLPEFLKINKEALKERIRKFNREVFSQDDETEAPLVEYLSSLSMAHSFAELSFVIADKDLSAARKMLAIK